MVGLAVNTLHMYLGCAQLKYLDQYYADRAINFILMFRGRYVLQISYLEASH
jgi:hypothetical protein